MQKTHFFILLFVQTYLLHTALAGGETTDILQKLRQRFQNSKHYVEHSIIPNNIAPYSSKCKSALLDYHKLENIWHFARKLFGLQGIENLNQHHKDMVYSFFHFSDGILLYNIDYTHVPYIPIWKCGNQAIKENLYNIQTDFYKSHLPHITPPIFDSNHYYDVVDYLLALRQQFGIANASLTRSFTFVRHPMGHFESGLAEYYFRCTENRSSFITSGDIKEKLRDLLDFKGMSLSADTCVESRRYSVAHVFPMAGAMVGPFLNSNTFVGKLENFSADWDTATGVHLGRGAPGGGARAGLPFDKRVGYHMTSDHPFANAIRRSFRRLLAADSSFAKALCALLYVDFACFDYPLWPACKDIREDMEHMLFS